LQVINNRIHHLKEILIRVRQEKFPQHPRLQGFILFLLVLLLSGVPPVLVMGDRWFKIFDRAILNGYWCNSEYFCRSMLPSYFVIVFPCIAGLLLVMFFLRHQPDVIVEKSLVIEDAPEISKKQSRVGSIYIVASVLGFAIVVITSLLNQHFPGWSLVYVWLAFMVGCALYSIRQDSIIGFWQKNNQLWIAMLLAHISLVLFLAGNYGQPELFWTTLFVLLLALANLWRFRSQIPIIYWIVSLALIVYTIDINGWWTAALGDEYVFHDAAWKIAEKFSFSELGAVLFQGNGAHGTHPYFSSFLMAISMKLFGHENFGWRFANPYISAMSVGLLYLFCRNFISERLSLITAFLLAVSSYIMAFSKIGYNNLQALFALTFVLVLAVWAARSRTMLAYASLGSSIAFCFYVYPAALYIPPLALLLLLFYSPPKTRTLVKLWLVMLGVFVALIFPLFMQPIYWQTKVGGTALNQPLLFVSVYSFIKHIIDNFIYSMFSFLYISSESHFISSSYLDPISSGLFLIGFSFLIYQVRRQKFAFFILLSYMYFIFIIGVSHDRDAPPNTRMFMFLPLYVLIAAWGLQWIVVKSKKLFTIPVKLSPFISAAAIVIITGVNLYQAYPLSHSRFAHLAQIESLFIRITQHVYAAEPNTFKKYAVIVDDTWGVDGLRFIQYIYPNLSWIQIEQIRISEPVLTETDLELLRDRNTFVIIMPWLNPEWVRELDAPLKAIGKVRCVISTAGNDKRFLLYHDPYLPQACYP
jgi:hypothetical protein